MADYSFDFLETIVAISFATPGGYLLITVTAMNNAGSVTPPPPPSFALTLGAKEKIIQQQSKTTTKITPAHDVTTRFWFVFNSVAGPVTPDNFQNVILNTVFPPVQFATQFARAVAAKGSGFKDPEAYGVEPVPEGGSGFFSTQAIAQGYADNWNSVIGPTPPIGAPAVFLSNGTPIDADPFPVSVQHVDAVVHVPAVSVTTITTKYLIKVPVDLTTLVAKVTANSQSNLLVTGYHGKAPATIAAADANPEDTSDQKGSVGNTTYTSTSVISGKPPLNQVALTASGGGGN